MTTTRSAPPNPATRIRKGNDRHVAAAGERVQGAVRHGARVPLRPFQTPVRGHAFAAAPDGGSEPEAGLRARLTREPTNPADPLAVAVWVETHDERPWRIGYLDRGVAARVAPRLDDGLHLDARIDGWIAEPEGRWHRPLVLLVPDTADDPVRSIGATSGTSVPSGGPDGRRAATGEHDTHDGASEPLWRRPPGVSRRRVLNH